MSYVEILESEGIFLNTGLGQHLLTTEKYISRFEQQTLHGNHVIEIGAGPGNLTERIACMAKKVTAIEIDNRFVPRLEELQLRHPNVGIKVVDAMTLNYKKLTAGGWLQSDHQIMSNLPFQISEPFVTRKLPEARIENAVLVVGKDFANKLLANHPASPDFTRTSFIAGGFFHTDEITRIPGKSFSPAPATDCSLVVLTPHDTEEARVNPSIRIVKNLVRNPRTPVGKTITETMNAQPHDGFDNKSERRNTRQMLKQYGEIDTRRRSTRDISALQVSPDILSSPFMSLGNQEIKILATALQKRFGWGN